MRYLKNDNMYLETSIGRIILLSVKVFLLWQLLTLARTNLVRLLRNN